MKKCSTPLLISLFLVMPFTTNASELSFESTYDRQISSGGQHSPSLPQFSGQPAKEQGYDYRLDMSYEGHRESPHYKEPSLVERAIRPIEADSVNWKLYVPITAQHIHKYYSKKKLSTLNERNYGLGIGRAHRYGAHEHEWYVMGFNDSHRNLQVKGGYNYSYHFHQGDGWSLAAGATVGLTSRENLTKRFPFPYVLPTAKLSAGNFELSALYVPNVNKEVKPLVFFWGAYKF